MKKLVSVIVPVYNLKDYLEKCLNSITNQTHINIEIILVDDGSTDGTSELCDLLGIMDERIQVIHKTNGGVTSARKAGLEVAKGEYILYIDGDDWINREMIAELLKLAVENDADIVTSGVLIEEINCATHIYDSINEGIYKGEGKYDLCSKLLFNGSIENRGVLPYLCNKLIKRDLLKRVFMQLDDKITLGEDLATTYVCCVKAEKVIITHKAYYHYIMRETSASHSKHLNFLGIVNQGYLFMRENFELSEYREVLVKQLEMHFAKAMVNGINKMLGFNVEINIPDYSFPKNIIEKNSKIILYGAGRVGKSFYKHIIIDKLYTIVGWVDKNFLKYQEENMCVESIEDVIKREYDYILLAINQEEMALNIKKILVEQKGIKEDKILWFKPINILDLDYFKTSKSFG